MKSGISSFRFAALLCIALSGAGQWSWAAPGKTPVSRWDAAGALTVARAGACAVTLPDGRVLVTGGRNESGILESAEFLRADGVSEPAPPMTFARAGHVCAVLKDGSVLVAAGVTRGGAASASAELLDPATGTWQPIGWLSMARAGAAAAVLKDGRVVVAGGESAGALIPTIEVFDPESRTFSTARGTLTEARKDHAVAVLRDGRVLIAGGSSGARSLATLELFDPSTGDVSPAGQMMAPRAGLTATTLLNGRVFLAGGFDGSEELASTEIWNPADGRTAPAAPMDMPRRGHLALRVPDNNSVLIFGGTWRGEPLPSSGLYVPWRDSYEPMAQIAAAVAGAAGAAMSGKVVMAGGSARAATSQEVYSADLPTIRTDKTDYSPGESVTILGENWLAGARVDLVVRNVATGAVRWQRTGEAAPVAGSDGRLLLENAFAMTREDAYQTFELVATEQSTGRTAATWTFTDSPKVGSVSISPLSHTVTAGSSATYTITVNRGSDSGSSGNFTAALSITTTLPAGVTASFSPNPVELEPKDNSKTSTLTLTTTGATPAGTYTFTVKAATSASDFATGDGTLVVQAACTAPQITAHPASRTVLVGDSVTFSVIATGTGPLSYQWLKNGSSIDGATGSSYTISNVAFTDNRSSYSVKVSNSCGEATSSTATLTVNKRDVQVSLTLSPNEVVIGQESEVTVTVTDTSPGTKQTPSGTINLTSNPTGVTFPSCTLSEVSLGVAKCTTTASAAAANDYTITANFAETSIHKSGSDSKTLKVTKRDVQVSLTLSPNEVVIGQESEVTVTVTDTSPGTKQTPSGTINLTSNPTGVTFPSCTLSEVSLGVAKCTTTASAAAAGDYSITANFAETTVHKAGNDSKTLKVTKREVQVSLTLSPGEVVIGQTSSVEVTVTDTSPGTKQTPSGTINLTSNPTGVTFPSCTLSKVSLGVAKCTTTASAAAAGNYEIQANYSGSEIHKSGSDTKTLKVNKRDVQVSLSLSPSEVVIGQGSTVTVTVEDISQGTKQRPSGDITLTSIPTGVTFGTCSLTPDSENAAAAKCTTTASAAAAGNYEIQANYSGSEIHKSGSDTKTLKVNKRDVQVSLSLSPSEVVIGQGSTVTVTVEDISQGTKQRPSGDITLTSIPIGVTFGTCSLTPDSENAAAAKCTTTASAAAAGDYLITANFAETPVHKSGSDSKTLKVNKRRSRTTVTLASSSVDEGGTVTVTATVEDIETAGPKITPAGTVNFSGPSTVVQFLASSCTLSGSGGSASCSVTLKAIDGPSTPTITATFPESAQHLGSTGTASLTVNNVAPTIGTVTGLTADPWPVGTTLTVTATFTDPGKRDTHTCTVNWDDGGGELSGTVTETDGNGTCTASRTFLAAGVYQVTITVTDKDGGTGTYTFQYVVIYDPSAGFVTGGGWIDSPLGAYRLNPALTGKATFGFFSRYRKGANVPEGNTEFQFHAAGMNFKSSSYQWLVVSGPKAQFKGVGTINGQGNYGFLLTATDGQMPGGGGLDKFRIKIWDIGSGVVVYDNVPSASDDIDAANPQVISGGSIVIHSK